MWERVAALARQLDRAGQFMQVTDLTVAACALEADAAVLTLDSDFTRVPGLRVLRTLGCFRGRQERPPLFRVNLCVRLSKVRLISAPFLPDPYFG